MKKLAWILVFAILFSCKNKDPKNEVLPQERMAKLMWDMIQVDELSSLKLVKDSTKNEKKQRIGLYEQVFQLHNTSQKQFAKSYDYYSDHPDKMKVIFDTLEARGVRERTSNMTRPDSLPK